MLPGLPNPPAPWLEKGAVGLSWSVKFHKVRVSGSSIKSRIIYILLTRFYFLLL